MVTIATHSQKEHEKQTKNINNGKKANCRL